LTCSNIASVAFAGSCTIVAFGLPNCSRAWHTEIFGTRV
jgi:hypothetical protein